jgi:hypothetical protein
VFIHRIKIIVTFRVTLCIYQQNVEKFVAVSCQCTNKIAEYGNPSQTVSVYNKLCPVRFLYLKVTKVKSLNSFKKKYRVIEILLRKDKKSDQR